MPQLTIFTPTYNRRELLARCYRSLTRQTSKDFKWYIVDDGSTDSTESVVSEWLTQDVGFEIRYLYKENGGLHTAYNAAIEAIDTELCVCLDSDDWMPDNAVETILDFWRKYGSDDVAGIVGLDFTSDGQIIGDRLPDQRTINLIDLAVGKYPIVNGDRTNVVRTRLYKKYAPMPVYAGEKFFNPHYLHMQISQEYDFLILNENLRFVEYQPGGMSDSIFRQYYNSPNSFMDIRLFNLKIPNVPLKFKMRNSVHLVSSGLLAGRFLEAIRATRPWILVPAYMVLGAFLAAVVRLKNRGV